MKEGPQSVIQLYAKLKKRYDTYYELYEQELQKEKYTNRYIEGEKSHKKGLDAYLHLREIIQYYYHSIDYFLLKCNQEKGREYKERYLPYLEEEDYAIYDDE